jgi:hypothetical protein
LKSVNYSTGDRIKIGDRVKADGMTGTVVCDFDNRELLEGYAEFDTPYVEMLGGGKLNSGVMIDTEQAGLVHYPHQDQRIVRTE